MKIHTQTVYYHKMLLVFVRKYSVYSAEIRH
jgi:hypothetical protein